MLRCPHCGEELSPSPFSDATFAGCPNCGSLWLDTRAYMVATTRGLGPEALAVVRAFDSTESSDENTQARFQGYRESAQDVRQCPVCQTVMDAVSPLDAGVQVDVCTQHGVFFDRLELRHDAQLPGFSRRGE